MTGLPVEGIVAAACAHGRGTASPRSPDASGWAGEVIDFESILVAPGLGQATNGDSLLVREEGCEVLSTAERRLW